MSPAWAHTIVGTSSCASALERGRTHPALLVGGHRLHPLLAETEHATGDADGHVRLVGGDHPHRRSAVKAIRLDIPARVPEHGGERPGGR